MRCLCLQGRLPELQELQRQLALTAEELADLQYSSAQQRTASEAAHAAAQEEASQLAVQLSSACAERTALQSALEVARREGASASAQLADATELYAGLQGELTI